MEAGTEQRQKTDIDISEKKRVSLPRHRVLVRGHAFRPGSGSRWRRTSRPRFWEKKK